MSLRVSANTHINQQCAKKSPMASHPDSIISPVSHFSARTHKKHKQKERGNAVIAVSLWQTIPYIPQEGGISAPRPVGVFFPDLFV